MVGLASSHTLGSSRSHNAPPWQPAFLKTIRLKLHSKTTVNSNRRLHNRKIEVLGAEKFRIRIHRSKLLPPSRLSQLTVEPTQKFLNNRAGSDMRHSGASLVLAGCLLMAIMCQAQYKGDHIPRFTGLQSGTQPPAGLYLGSEDRHRPVQRLTRNTCARGRAR